MFNNFYLMLGAACLTWYGAATLFGWEFGNPRRFRAPPLIVAGPGGPTYYGRSPGGHGSSHSGSYGFGGGK